MFVTPFNSAGTLRKARKEQERQAEQEERRGRFYLVYIAGVQMSAFNAFFAQLTGGGNSTGGAPSSTTVAAPAPRGTPAADGGSVGAGGGGRGGTEVFGVPLTGAAITYDPDSDRNSFGNPQVATFLCVSLVNWESC